MSPFPRLASIVQEFPHPRLDRLENKITELFQNGTIRRESITGKRIAITAGSRGITNLAVILKSVIQTIRAMGGDPFIIPAMGSHGGGTEEGQRHILADYGVTPEAMEVPILSSLETVRIGQTSDGVPVHIARTAYEADGVLVLNRIKPHTDFIGENESGLLKMITVGMGKVDGAQTFHSRTAVHAYDYLIRTISQRTLQTGKILGGLAILENAYHETAMLELIPPGQLAERDKQLLQQAKAWMPSLPVEQADILIVDRIGKDISGVGMDPNITGRRYQINRHWPDRPDITRILVLDVSEASAGNAVGIGLADFCSKQVVEKMDKRVTYLNAVTSRNTVCSNIPLHFDTDREMFRQTLISIGDIPPQSVRMLRIRDTLNLTHIEASEALLPELRKHPHVREISGLHEMAFNEKDDLIPLQVG